MIAPLLAHCLLDSNGEFERLGQATGQPASLLVWSDVLRPIPGEGIAVTDLPGAARVSRRAMRSWLTRLESLGWLEQTAADRGGKRVRLTADGEDTKRRWGELAAEAERAWRDKVGEELATALRDALEAVVGQVPLELPHYPMIYGSADPGALGGRAVAASAKVPAHGADWVPVLRAGQDSLQGLPLSALVSQAIMAFTIDYEGRAGCALSVAALLARAIPGGAVSLGDLPPILGVNGSGRSGLERHRIVAVSEGRVTLTAAGRRIRDGHATRLNQVSEQWRERYGSAAIDSLVSALGAVDDRVEQGLPDFVLIRYGGAFGFRDVSRSEAARPAGR